MSYAIILYTKIVQFDLILGTHEIDGHGLGMDFYNISYYSYLQISDLLISLATFVQSFSQFYK